jgi:hypothetical protein
MAEKLSSPRRNPNDAKRRIRAIKRKTRPPKEGPPIHAAAGQRKAIRGTRLRQRRT